MSDQEDRECTAAACGEREVVRVGSTDTVRIESDYWVGRILSALDTKLQYDESKQRIIDRLYDQLDEQRTRLGARAARSYVLAMIQHHAEISKLMEAVGNAEEAELSREKMRELLGSLQRDMDGVLDGGGDVDLESWAAEGAGTGEEDDGQGAVSGVAKKGSGTGERGPGPGSGGGGDESVLESTTAADDRGEIGAGKIKEIVERVLIELENRVKYDVWRDGIIERLNRALRRQEEKLLEVTTSPYKAAVVRHRAEIGKRLEWLENEEAGQGVAGGGGEVLLAPQFRELLWELRKDVEERLDGSGVALYQPKEGDKFDPLRHTLVGRATFTEERGRSGTIAGPVGPGFEYEGKVLVRARVKVYSVQGSEGSR